jgi:hypothetical protein
MTLKYMQGFETMRDDSDLRAQGWTSNPNRQTARNVAINGSVTGLAGYSLRPLGPYSSPSAAVSAWGVTTANDFGYYNTGITVNQAWTAGGMTFGWGAKFNGGALAAYGTGQSGNTCQACFDGTKYWALQYNGSAYNVATSPDLINWTLTAAQPAVSMQGNATISYMGGSIVAVIINTTQTAAQVVNYTNNNGASWSVQTLTSNIGGSGASTGVGIATGNSTYPHAVIVGTQFGGSGVVVYVGTLGGTMTAATSVTSGTGTIISARPRIIGSLLVFMSSSTQIVSATAASSTLNTSAAWTSTAALSISVASDIAYNPVSNLWVIVNSSGIYTFANSGAAGTPVAPSGTPSLTQRYSTVGIQNVVWNGSQLVAFGLQGHIVTSPDGITWTETGGHILAQGVSGYDWRGVINDGSRYVLFSDGTNGIIATSPDGVTNYACVYAQEQAENAVAISANVLGTCLVGATTVPASNGIFTPYTADGPVMFQVGPVSSSARPYALDSYQAGSAGVSGSIATSTLYHYYELKYTKSAATANTFTCSLYIDGTLIGTTTAHALAASTDTTSNLVAVFQRNGVFTAIDDMYVTVDDGLNIVGPLGQINIVAQRPETDVQDNWVKNGSASTNSLSVNQSALSSLSTNYISSQIAGDKDIYTTTDGLPVGYTPRAVQTEAYVSKLSATPPVVNVGIISGGVESDSTSTSITSGQYLYDIAQVNPNGNVAWTTATVNAAQFTLNHVS